MNPQPANLMSFGVATSIFGHRDALTPAKIKSLEQTGIDFIEIGALQEQHISIFDQPHLDGMARAVRDSSLQVWSLHAPFCGFAMDDPDTRRYAVRRLILAGRAAARMGAKYVVVHPGRDVPIVNRARELQWCRESLEQAMEQFPETVHLALETMGRDGLACPPDELLSVIENLDKNRIGICFDSGHVNLGYDLTQYIQTVGHRIVTLHLHDNRGQHDDHAIPGQGNIDWPALIKTLHQVGYSGVWMGEFGMTDTPPPQAARKYVEKMKQYADS